MLADKEALWMLKPFSQNPASMHQQANIFNRQRPCYPDTFTVNDRVDTSADL